MTYDPSKEAREPAPVSPAARDIANIIRCTLASGGPGHGDNFTKAAALIQSAIDKARAEALEQLIGQIKSGSESGARAFASLREAIGIKAYSMREDWSDVKIDGSAFIARAEAAERECAELRKIVSDCADALGNGAIVSPDCSIEFMQSLPSEIGLHVASLCDERDHLKEDAATLRAELAELRKKAGKMAEALKCARPHG